MKRELRREWESLDPTFRDRDEPNDVQAIWASLETVTEIESRYNCTALATKRIYITESRYARTR